MSLLAALAHPAGALVPQPEAYCFAVADSGDNLVFINKDGDGFVDLGSTGTSTMEAIAFNPGVSSCGQVGSPRNLTGCLYATHDDNFGFLDYDDSFDTDGNDSEFIEVSADVGSCDLDGDGTAETAINDVDGLQFDTTRTDASTGTFVLWATERTGGNDIIFQIDPTTGLIDTTPTPGFAGGASCVQISGAGILGDLDDIAIDATDGKVYAVNNTGGTIDLLVEVDPVTGAGTIIGNFFNPLLQVQDMEGLSFGVDGQLYGTTGTSNEFFRVEKSNALAIPIVDFNDFSGLGDYEAIACLTDNLITGTVFFDVDGDGLLDAVDGDAGFGGARVLVYIDNNNDGTVDPGDTLLCDNPGGGFNLACPVTAPDGFYLFTVGQGNFAVEVDTATLPAGHLLSTDNIEEADFANTDFGQVDPDNDFGFTIPPGAGGLDVTKSSDAGGPVVQGQMITYTISVTNNTGATNRDLRLTDTLPAGVTYDLQSTVVTGPVSQLFQTLDEFAAASYSNDDGRDSWAGPWVETDLDGGGGPTGGEVQVVASELRLTNSTAGNLPFIDRPVDLSAYAGAGALLKYQFRVSSGVDTTDSIVVEASNGGPFGVVDTITNLGGPALRFRTVDLTDFIGAPTVIRFRVAANYNDANEFFFVDDVEVLAGENYRDVLDTAAVNRQDGSFTWTTDWLEIGEADGPGAGDTRIGIAAFGRNVMQVQDSDSGPEGWQREADLSTAGEAILSFLFRRDQLDDVDDYVDIEASDDGGATWSLLARLDGASGNDAVFVPAALDITAFAATNTRIRFLSSPTLGGGDRVLFDNISILVPRVMTLTKDNVPAGVNRDLVAGVPPVLVDPADAYLLPDGETLTATLRVVVDNPLDPYSANLLNTVVVTSDLTAGSAVHNDPVVSGVIGDRVWLDTDGDGVQDVGEEGIANVVVELRDGSCTPGVDCPTALTGTDGEYLFDHLPPGGYTVAVLSGVPAGLVPSPGNTGSVGPVVVTTDEIFLDADFGYTAPPGTGVIGDYVWNDIDRDGVQDPTELGIGGVTLDLVSAGPDGVFGTADDIVVSTTTTNADGSYLFTGVMAGEYILVVTDTGGELAGFMATAGPQSEGSSVSAPVTVLAGDLVDDVDFGYAPVACLPRIDFETDAAGDPLVAGQVIDDEWSAWGIAVGFTINPPDNGPLMIFDSSNPTGGDVDLGSPNETCVPPGPGVGIEGELGQPGENCFPQGNILILSEDGDASDPDDSAAGGSITFTFADALEIDSLSFLDAENNQDSVEVRSTATDNYRDEFATASFNNNDGSQSWSADWVEVDPEAGGAGPSAGQVQVVGGTLRLDDEPDTGGEPSLARAADLSGATAAVLSFDFSTSADVDAADAVTVEVSSTGTGGPFTPLETFTGIAGATSGSRVFDISGFVSATTAIRFRVSNLYGAANEFFFVDNVDIRTPLFYSNLTAPGDNAFERLPVDTSGARELIVTFPASGSVASLDFCLGSLRDKVWLDANEDGLFQLSEAGIPGVTVSLLSDPDGVPNNGDEVVVATTVTDANGDFAFDGLEDGDYLIQITDTGGELNNLGGTTAPGIARELAVSVVDGDDVIGINFGYNAAGTLGDRVWSDVDGDGVQDAGEPGISGVLLNLLDGLGNPVLDSGGVPITAVTAADGSYLFSGLAPGDYIVEVAAANFGAGQPLAGYSQTGDPDEPGTCVACDDQGASTLGFGASDLTLDFGYQATSAAVYPISGTVFEDDDEDGFHDQPGESGFAGVTVELRDAAGKVIAVTTTDASGDYLFADQPNGDYTVAVTDVAGVLEGYRLTSGLDAIDVVVAGAPVTDVDFGYIRDPRTASIGDTVWFDADGDGLRGPAEAGIPGVALDLYQDVDGDGVLEPTVELFSGRIDLDGDGAVDAFDDGALAGIAVIDGRLDLDGDGAITAADDGSFNGATVIDGEIDLDGSGGVDGADTGTLVGDDGLPVATTVTDANGQYLFPGLAAGGYFVDLQEGTLPDSTADGIPDLVETGYPAGVDPSAAITLSEGERYEDADFGYLPRPGTAAIGDRVWHDTDGDGVQDDGEVGIAGVDITVSGPSGDVTVTTGADGFWMVTGLTPAADYGVNYDAATVPAGMSQTFPDDLTYVVTLNDGDLFTHLDYGFTGGTTGTVGDLVWLDLNGDGDVDSGEPGIEGVTVSLIRDTNQDGAWDPDGADDTFGTTDDERILETVATDAAGSYLFTGVPLSDAGDGDGSDADYLVDVTDIGGVLAGLQKTSGTAGANDNSQADPYPVTLDGTATDFTGDFGYTPAGAFGSIGNKVWHDLDFDGLRDAGEPGIEGVTVELWLDVDGDGVLTPGVDNLVRSAVTDASGEYEFNSLPFGDYLVDLTDDFGVLAGFVKTTGPVPGADDNSQADPYPLSLDIGTPSNVTGDFGYRDDTVDPALTISGTVFEDTDNDGVLDFVDGDGDGVYDPGEATLEPLVAGVTVRLYRVVGGSRFLIGTATTDVNGFYLFPDLPPGSYELEADTAASPVDGYLQTTQGGSGGVEPAPLPDGGDPEDPATDNSANNNFGFWNGGIVTTPITLAFFHAEEMGSGVRFEWVTATETGNIGFNLYGVGERGLVRLNDELIRSRVIDSLEPQRYLFEAWGIEAGSFVLEDVDLDGVRRYHGPFARGRARGVEPRPEQIPWQRIRAAREERRQAALQAGKARRGGRPPKGGRMGWPEAWLRVSADGIHRVTYEQLLAAGINLAGAPTSVLALTRGGEPVPIRVEGNGRFGPGAFIEFVGRGLDTLYTRDEVYTLKVSRKQALRVDRMARPAPPWAPAPVSYVERLEVDRDSRYILTSPSEDPWYEDHLLAYGGPAGRDFLVSVDGLVPGPAELELELWGLSAFPRDPDHHVELEWNGSFLGGARFDGRVVQRIAVELTAGALLEGDNLLRLNLPGDTGAAWDMVAFDRLALSYSRRFLPRDGRLRFTGAAEAFEIEGVTAPAAVAYRVRGAAHELLRRLTYHGDAMGYRVRLPGATEPAEYHFAEEGALLVPEIAPVSPPAALAGEARLLVVSHADFLEGIQPLVDARRAEGWTVATVSVDEVYARHSHGVVDPAALRKFIRRAARRHGTEAVLLVGGDTYDYHDNLGLGSISFIPSLYTATDEIVRFAPVDPLYGDTDSDGVPDVAVGRLPVRTPEELAALVERILEYGEIGFTGTALLAADAYDVPAGYSFTAASDEMAARLPAGWSREHAYLDELGRDGARELLLAGLNEGVAFTSYFGHSGPTAWSFQNLFNADDAAALENAGRPTVVTQWGCWNTYHVTPRYNTLGHKLLLSGDRGAAAVLGAATLTEAPAERKLGRLLYARIGRPGVSIGQALVEAKRELAAAEPDLVDVILGWTLLGDPTLVVQP